MCQGMLKEPRIQVLHTENLPEPISIKCCRDQRTWRRSPRAPYCPHLVHAWCGCTFESHAGFAQSTIAVLVVFHCARRWRVLLRDVFLFGTATIYSLLSSDVMSDPVWSAGGTGCSASWLNDAHLGSIASPCV